MHVETIFHVLLDCSFSRSCWAFSAVKQPVAGVEIEFGSWFFDLFDGCREDVVAEVAMVVKSVKHVLGQWKITKFESPNALYATGDISNSNCWRKPDTFTVKVNVNGATFEAHQKFGFDCVARNNHGKLLEAISESRWGCVPPEIAEVIGIKEALSWIKRKGWGKVVV
uniref:RNase H type-1 domain-containing protein n=1 Tax=Cannabis sativa TaxID=3483 RepID=A0A803NH64_CANSA